MDLNAHRRLVLILWLVAAHSFIVGWGLILIPASVTSFFGFEPYVQRFFPVQGGVFHLVISVGYALAAIDPDRRQSLVVLAVVAKFMAVVFLLFYYLVIDRIWLVLLSGVGDCLMGVAILLALLAFNRSRRLASRADNTN